MTDEQTPSEDPQDAVKRRFKEALDRKQGKNAATASGSGANASKIHGTHAAASSQKNFRRKSGG